MMEIPKEIDEIINGFKKEISGWIEIVNNQKKELEEKDKQILFLKGQLELFFRLHYMKEDKAEGTWETYRQINKL